MARFLVDTSVLVSYLRSFLPAYEFIEKFYSDIELSYVTVGELFQGARNKVELGKIKKLVGLFVVDLGSESSSELALSLLEKSVSASSGLRIADALIAATALENKLTLVTDNIKHFRVIPGLKLFTLQEVLDFGVLSASSSLIH